MESVAYQPAVASVPVAVPATVPVNVGAGRQPVAVGWMSRLPVLANSVVTLRPLIASDAPSLFSMIGAEEVRRFISSPPPDLAGFERFIGWAHAEAIAGRYACFAVVPAGYDVAVGLVQLRPLDPAFAGAEWGIALGSGFWGSAVFMAATSLFLDFVFNQVGVHRLEGRAAVRNGRANGAMRKLGAVQEGLLRRSLHVNGEDLDQLLWSILADDWRASRASLRPIVH